MPLPQSNRLLPLATALLAIAAVTPVVPGVRADSLGTWSYTARMKDARSDHTATLLADGQVLIAGGVGDGAAAIVSAELFDPRTGVWRPTGRMLGTPQLNTATTATLLPDGQVLVAGSLQSPNAELYDPNKRTWKSTGNMMTDRFGHTATLLPDGRVLITAGCGDTCGLLSSAEVYNPRSGLWAMTGSMLAARMDHTATLLPDGRVLAAGGCTSCIPLASAEIYDPHTGTWTATGPMHDARYGHTATLLPNGKVLVAGGCCASGFALDTAELYDPHSGTWAVTGHMIAARASHTATLLTSGKVLVTGGWDQGSFSSLSSAELYDPETGTWAAAADMTTGRRQHTATLLPSGRVLVAGGVSCDPNPPVTCHRTASAEMYAPSARPLTMVIHVPSHSAFSQGPLTARIDTAPHVRVVFMLTVQGIPGRATYRVTLYGTTDSQGQLIAAVRSHYVPSRPTLALLTVMARTVSGTTTQTVTVTLVH
jgi:hypothetical protein